MTTQNTTTAAQQAGVTVATIRTWCRVGAVAAAKIGGRWVIETTSLAYRISLGQPRRIDRTGDFAHELMMQAWGLADRYATAALRALLLLVKARDTQTIAGIPGEHVHLTDQQWADLAREVSFQISCLAAEH